MNLELHIHDDIEEAAKYYNIPLTLWDKEYVYIIQEDRCVFVGNSILAKIFYEKNRGIYCKSKFLF